MARRRWGRENPRERQIRINAALRFYGVPLQSEVPPDRRRAPRQPSDKPLEKDVLADVLEALRNDPLVAIVDRRQSGVFQDGERYIRVGTKGVLDISGMLKGGRYFEIEVKREGQHPDENQKRRIEQVQRGGGISGCAHDAEEATQIIRELF